jgi:hypothetical protein
LVNSERERRTIWVAGARNDAIVGWIDAMETPEVTMVESQHGSPKIDGERKDLSIRNPFFLDFVDANLVKPKSAKLHNDRKTRILVAEQLCHRSIALVLTNGAFDFVGMFGSVRPSRRQIRGRESDNSLQDVAIIEAQAPISR